MALDSQGYVFSLQSNLRSRPVAWDGAVRAKTLSEDAYKKIKAIDKVRKEQRIQILESENTDYVTLFLGKGETTSIFQQVTKRPEILHYLLVLLDDAIQDSDKFIHALLQHSDPYAPFIPLIQQAQHPDDVTPLLASIILTKLLSKAVISSKPSQTQATAIKALFKYLAILGNSSDQGHQDIAVQSYSNVLRTRYTREIFWNSRKGNLDPLFDILRTSVGASKDSSSTLWSDGASSLRPIESGISGGVGIQLVYRVLLVLWQLSFEAELVGEGLQDEQDIIILYTQLIRLTPKEKISRLLLSTLNNLLSANRSTLLPAAVLARLPAALGTLKSKHLTDPDLLEDLNALTELLDDYTATQTTFDEYAAEIHTGHLRWSPVHRSESFWRENARKILEENKGELVRALAEILAKDWESDKQVLAIGCNDIACLVREVPEKRPVLEKAGLKGRVMELMQDSNESVRWESLRAVGEWLRYSFEK